MQDEIIVFTEGDSLDSSVWSNIPYFLTKTLESKNIQVHRVDVSGPVFLEFLYNKFFRRIVKLLFFKNTTYSYNRSIVFHFIVNHKMKKAVKKYSNSICTISTSFSFSPYSFFNKPTILLCDWTYEYLFDHFLKRNPDIFEKYEIKVQSKVIGNSNFILPLSPDISEILQVKYPESKVIYLGSLVNCEEYTTSTQDILEKYSKHSIVFIGIKKYIEGAIALIEAVTTLTTEFPNITLHIIGMEQHDFEYLPQNVICYGYLKKSDSMQMNLYNKIINEATVYVNTTPEWAAPSATLEALYHYTPIITAPFSSIIEVIGTTLSFGYYSSNNATEIASHLRELFNSTEEEYVFKCQSARATVDTFSWDSYVDKIISLFSK